MRNNLKQEVSSSSARYLAMKLINKSHYTPHSNSAVFGALFTERNATKLRKQYSLASADNTILHRQKPE